MFGHERDAELLGHSIVEYIAPGDRDRATANIMHMFQGTSAGPDEYRAFRADGSPIMVEVNGDFITGTDGRAESMIFAIRDITDRKNLEQELHDSEERYRTLFNEALIGICMADVETGIITDCNQAMSVLTGKPVDELVGSHQTSLHPAPECNRPYSTTFMQHRNEYAGAVLRDRLITSSGEIRDVEIKGRAFEFHDKQVLLGTFFDITERIQAEEELRKRNVEIEQFIYTVSHDLRSPLVTVKTFLGFLEQDISCGDNERIGKDMGFMHTAADRMEALLNELLDLSRIGRATIPDDEVTFRELAAETLDALAGQIATGRVSVRVSAAADPTLCGDRRRLLQIWQNLLDNALKYMGDQEAPDIEIGVEQQQGETVFTVCDNGIGIAPEYAEKVFGIFEKLDRNTGGVGMGLTMVRRIVEMYGGHISVESAGFGRGCCFRFTLPEAVKRGEECAFVPDEIFRPIEGSFND
jgi:PAS domain S-box-containing protein